MNQINDGVWFASGVLLGWISFMTQVWTVKEIRPSASRRDVLWAVVGGAVLRWVGVASLLIVALDDSVRAGLLAFVGLWSIRWWMVYQLERRTSRVAR
ncbi:MAG: hypothetical protein ACLFTI_07435 [Anaerolineales bacterium]